MGQTRPTHFVVDAYLGSIEGGNGCAGSHLLPYSLCPFLEERGAAKQSGFHNQNAIINMVNDVRVGGPRAC
jgi:hypothetical protein